MVDKLIQEIATHFEGTKSLTTQRSAPNQIIFLSCIEYPQTGL